MKRAVLLLLVLLMIDLAEDGQFGKATFVAPQSDAETLLVSSLVDYSGEVDSSNALPEKGCKINRLLQGVPVTIPVQPILRIIIYNHTNSSGGIPL